MSAFVTDLVNQDQPLTVRLLQVSHHLAHRGENRAHRKRQAVHPTAFATSGLLPISDVVKPRVTNCSTLLGIVELLAVVREDRIEAAPCGVRHEAQILLALPMEVVNVDDIVARQVNPDGVSGDLLV